MSRDQVLRRLKLGDLRLLVAVAEWGSMAKAAAHLNLTQSGISRAIAQLEDALGVRLLDRTAHGVEPTLYGHALLKRAIAIFDELRQGAGEIERLADPAAGELRLGCTEPMTWGIVPAVIERLAQQYPRLTFHVVQDDPGALRHRDLHERKIELAIGRIAGPLAYDRTAVEVLYEERVFIVAGESSPWARRRRIRLEDLADAHWSVPPPGSVSGSFLVDAFQSAGLPAPRIGVVTFSLAVHHTLLATGRFLSVFPGSLLRFSAKRMALKALPVDVSQPPGPVGILTLKNRTLSPVAELFIQQARQVARRLA